MVNYVYSELSKKGVVNTSRFVINELQSSADIHESIKVLTTNNNGSDIQLVVYDSNGTVLGDSLQQEGREISDEERLRIADALDGRFVAFFSKNEVLDNDTVSYYEKLENAGVEYIVRISIPLSPLYPYISLIFPIALILSFIIAIAVLKIKGSLYYDVIEPLDAVASAVEGLSGNHYNTINAHSRYREIDVIIERLNDYLHSKENIAVFNMTDRKKINFIIQNLPVGVLALSDDFTVLLCNNTALRVFKKSKNIVGNNLREFFPDSLLSDKIADTVNAGGQGTFTYRLDEKVYRVEISLIEFADAGVPRREILVVFTDVTAESNLDVMRSEFFANASHELKTPITATLGFSELLLLDPNLDESIKPKVENIHRNSERMYQLIQDMMELARLDAGTQQEENVVVDVREIVAFAIHSLTPRAEDLNLTFKVRGKAFFYGDYKQIEQIVLNLLSNAVKYNVLDGMIYVDINYDEEKTIFKVRDTGKGIPWQDLPRIFERFYCVDKGRTRKAGSSTGLGLAIIKQILIRNGGKVTAQSIFGKATQFTIVLPRNEEDNALDISTMPVYKDDEFDTEEKDVFGIDMQLRRVDETVSIAESSRWIEEE